MRTALAVVIVTLLAGPEASAQAPDFSKGTATVLVFTTTDCPISNRYAPEINRLAKKFSSQGILFVLVYPVPSDTNEAIAKHTKAFAYHLPVFRDSRQAMVKFAGVSVTPEVAVVWDGRIAYRGRIDDRYVDFGKDRPAPTTHDLEDALNAVVAGKPIAVAETKAVGCYLADLIK